jgi:hypothetical protein
MTEKEINGLSESFNREEYNSPEIFNREMQKIYGPNIEKNSPALISNETSLTTTRSPYDLNKFLRVTAPSSSTVDIFDPQKISGSRGFDIAIDGQNLTSNEPGGRRT